MLDYLADQLLALLERVLKDALAHNATSLFVTGTPAGFRFDTDSGASLAHLPRRQVDWLEIRTIFERLRADAEANGHPQCVTIHDGGEDITVTLKGHERYFRSAAAIMQRLRG